jgi:hypothetical protein
MTQLQSPTAVQEESLNATAKGRPRRTQLAAETIEDSAESAPTTLLVVTGCVAAAMATSLCCQLPKSHAPSWATILLLAAAYIALATAVGALGIALPWFFFRSKPPFHLAFLAEKVAPAWIFFPCIILLYRLQSEWMFSVLSLATIALAFSLRQVFPPSAETNQADLSASLPSDLPSLYGLPATDSRPMHAVFIAICAQVAILFAAAEYLFLAGLLLSTSLFLLVRRSSASEGRVIREFSGRGQFTLLCAFAFIITVLTLIPWVGNRLHSGFAGNEASHHAPPPTHQSTEADKPNSDYVGVVLWAPPIKKEILPPIPHSNSFRIGRASRPIVIPFDGQYWYFKAPSKRPGPRAHVAHGKSTEVNVRSSDFAPLLMEAYQNLGSSIDLSCCSGIDVAITNADIRPGQIALSILLTDSNSLGQSSRNFESINLGERVIPSSEPAQIPMNRPPVNEVLHFPISTSATTHQFNEITIIFLPAQERSHAGAKVSIQNFTLVPR